MRYVLGVVFMAIAVCVAACADPPSPTSPNAASTRADSATSNMAASSVVRAAVTPSCTPDTTPPTITSVSATPSALWPPDHKMAEVTVHVTATDDCSPVSCHITSVTSNEPVNGVGDGNTSPDWMIDGPLTVDLRAERSGVGDGRIYTINVTCADAAGNHAMRSTDVTVAHDQGR